MKLVFLTIFMIIIALSRWSIFLRRRAVPPPPQRSLTNSFFSTDGASNQRAPPRQAQHT